MKTGKFTDEEMALFQALEAKKAPVQKQLDDLNEKIKAASKQVIELQGKVRALKPQLVPLAEMQAALSDSRSRDKYFPDFSKNDFIAHVTKTTKTK